jgi:hypothetical protein
MPLVMPARIARLKYVNDAHTRTGATISLRPYFISTIDGRYSCDLSIVTLFIRLILLTEFDTYGHMNRFYWRN